MGAVARLLIESGADPDHVCDEGYSARTMAPDTMRALQDERDRAVTTAAVAASIMSGLCGENTGSLLASFLATPWMLSRILCKLCGDTGFQECDKKHCTKGSSFMNWHWTHDCTRPCTRRVQPMSEWVAFGAELRG